MPVLRAISTLYACRPEGGQGDVHAIPAAALAFRAGRITWMGPEAALPASEDDGVAWDAGGRMVIPGLVDAHTHLGFGGFRADEFVARNAGASYQELAARGGGIASTVRATRALGEEALRARCSGFLGEMLALGVTAIEAKSGYGLDRETELRILRVYRDLDAEGPVRIAPTYLGAHVVPPELRDRRGDYVAFVAEQMIPLIAREGLARFVDVFVEDGAFSPGEARRIFTAARAAGLGVKLHADQLTDGVGAALAAEVGAVSADHLERVTPDGIAALARAGVVAVSLPLAGLYLGAPPPPCRALVAAGVPVAVATDFNPGSAPSYHLPLALTLACTQQRLTPAEALKGATAYGARAAGISDQAGTLATGRPATFVLLDAPDVEQWLYHFRANAALLVVVAGEPRARAAGFDEAAIGARA